MLAPMARRPFLPASLLRGPFTLEEARRAGLDRGHLQGDSWIRIGPSTYVWKEIADEPLHRLQASFRRLPPGSAFSGLTAAWLHGIDVSPCDPIEVTVPNSARVSARAGISVRRAALGKKDITKVRGMPATGLVRTVGEVCSRVDLVEAVVIADQALHSHRVSLDQLVAWAESRVGYRGVQKLRRVLDLAEPAAESPMESRLRMLLILNGLPRPKAQVSIHDRWGRFAGRPDLFYEKGRLGIEYDGGVHREQLAEDNRRQNRLLNAGVRLLRFTAADVLHHQDAVVDQVRAMLASDEATPRAANAGARRLFRPEFAATAGARR